MIDPVPQFQGRVTISATQLRIGGAQLRDAGNYTVEVTPTGATGLGPNSRSIQLRVFGKRKICVPVTLLKREQEEDKGRWGWWWWLECVGGGGFEGSDNVKEEEKEV